MWGLVSGLEDILELENSVFKVEDILESENSVFEGISLIPC